MSNDHSPNYKLAMDYAAKNKPVFPTDPNTTGPRAKAPRCPNGFHDATTDRDKIKDWWTKNPDSAVGLPTGDATGLNVIDVDTKDGKKGQESISKLEERLGDLPLTFTVVTPSGGRQLYFDQNGKDIGSTNGKFGNGIDTRGNNGYVIAVGSVMSDGSKYQRDPELPKDMEELPDAWVEYLSGGGGKDRSQRDAIEGDRTLKALRELQAGDNFHGSLVHLTCRYAAKGIPPTEIEAICRAALEASQPKNADREQRRRDELAKLNVTVKSAFEKFGRTDEWADPEPLPEVLPDVDEFDPSLLPGPLRDMCVDISDRMQCPLDYPGVASMTALGSVLGTRIAVYPKVKDDWHEFPTSYAALIGRPGLMKSPGMDQALSPLYRLQSDERQAFLEAQENEGSDKEVLSVHLAAAKAKLKTKLTDSKKAASMSESVEQLQDEISDLKRWIDTEPKPPRRIVNDATVEKLCEILVDNPNGVLQHRDELTGWLRSMEREGRESDRAFWLEAASGKQEYTQDRIGRGTIHVRRVAVSVIGSIQPGPLMSYIRLAHASGSGADGLMQRFGMAVWPDDPGGWRDVDRYPNTDAKTAVYELFQRISNLDPRDMGAEKGQYDLPWGISFTPGGREVFQEWRKDLETTKLRSGEPEELEGHFSKYRKLMPALALTCHAAECDGTKGGIGSASAERAAAWCEYLESHARRIYATATAGELMAAKALLQKITAGAVEDGFTARSIYRRCWAGLGQDETKSALEVLEAHGWVRGVPIQTGGRSQITYYVHPSLK